MATGQAMMPILAQTFVDSKNGVVFDMIAASSPSSNLSPSRRSPASPTRRKDAKHKADANSDGSRTDIFSLSDAVLAERYQLSRKDTDGSVVRFAEADSCPFSSSS
jgi:hypothetical protein